MSDEFIEYVMELFGPFGTVGARRMFGGHGVYLDGLMFAIVSDDALYLKADEMNRIEFEQADCEIFGYRRKGKRVTLNFFRAPADAMESPELMLPWARTAYAAALRTNAKKRAHAAGNIAQTGAEVKSRAAKSARSASGRPAQPARSSKTARANGANAKIARPERTVKSGRRK
jgi:DNA transformation protein